MFVLLFLFLALSLAVAADFREAIPAGLVVLNHSMLSTWYDPVQMCMLEDRKHLANASYWAYLWDCEESLSVNKSKPAHSYSTGFATLPSSAYSRKARDGCCNSDVQIRDRGFDWAFKGHEDGAVAHAVAVMTLLSRRNMSLLFMGDSMNNQVFTAFVEECKREGIRGSFDAGVRGSLPWFQSPEAFGLTRKSLSYVGAVVKFDWTDADGESQAGGKNSTYIYVIDVWYGRRAVADERMLMEVLVPLLSANHPSGMAILPNIGHHLEAERSHNNYAAMVQTVSGFLNWMHELSKLATDGRNFVAFRETTPSHFDSPDADGSFEKWKAAGRGNYDYMAPNSWDGTLYHCHSINTSLPATNTLENLVVRDILRAWKNQQQQVPSPSTTSNSTSSTSSVQIGVLHVFQYLAPFYRLKYGFCGGYDRIPTLDCVHFCAWGPTMWIPIWAELSSMLTEWSLQHKEHPNVIIRTSPSTSSSSFTYTPIFGKVILEDALVLESASAPAAVFLYYHGVRHLAPSLRCIEEELGILSNSSAFPKAKSLSWEELVRIPLGNQIEEYPVIQDGSALQQHGDGQIWFFKNGSRHAIPNWDTFCSLGFGRASIVHLSDNVMDRLPVGSAVPPRDWPSSC